MNRYFAIIAGVERSVYLASDFEAAVEQARREGEESGIRAGIKAANELAETEVRAEEARVAEFLHNHIDVIEADFTIEEIAHGVVALLAEAQPEEPGEAVEIVTEILSAVITDPDINEGDVARRIVSALSARPAEEGRWIPVSERLPEERVEVAAYFRTGDITEVHIGEVKGGTWGDRHGGEWLAQPTHWMPLPAPSQSGGKP